MYLIAKIDGYGGMRIITKCKTRIEVIKYHSEHINSNYLVIKADDISKFVDKSE